MPGELTERKMQYVRGNILRGREKNENAVEVWFVASMTWRPMKINMTLHKTMPALVGDGMGFKMWEGQIVAAMCQGNEFEPPLMTDITMTAYRLPGLLVRQCWGKHD